MPMIQGTTDTAAGASTSNCLAGSVYEYLPYNCLVEVSTVDDTNGNQRVTILSGSDVLLEEAPVQIGVGREDERDAQEQDRGELARKPHPGRPGARATSARRAPRRPASEQLEIGSTPTVASALAMGSGAWTSRAADRFSPRAAPR